MVVRRYFDPFARARTHPLSTPLQGGDSQPADAGSDFASGTCQRKGWLHMVTPIGPTVTGTPAPFARPLSGR